jgi:hypothetical protein
VGNIKTRRKLWRHMAIEWVKGEVPQQEKRVNVTESCGTTTIIGISFFTCSFVGNG